MKNVVKVLIMTFSLLAYLNALADTGTTTTSTVTSTSNNGNNNGTTVQSTITTKTAPNTISDDDAHIMSAIYDLYAKSSALIGTTLTVNSQNGVITLNGTVTAQSQADEAAILAKSVNGVKEVKSSINVTTHPSIKPISRTMNY